MNNLIKNYIVDNTYKIIIDEKSLYIYNYVEIIKVTSEVIIISMKDKDIKISGASLIISKLSQKEMLIIGVFKKVEL